MESKTQYLERKYSSTQAKINDLTDHLMNIGEDLKHSYIIDTLIDEGICPDTEPLPSWYGYSHSFTYNGYYFKFESSVISGNSWTWSCCQDNPYNTESRISGTTDHIGDLIPSFIRATNMLNKIKTVFQGWLTAWRLECDGHLVFKINPEYNDWNIEIYLNGCCLGCITSTNNYRTDEEFRFEGDNGKLAYYETNELKIVANPANTLESDIARPLPIYLSDPDVSIGVITHHSSDIIIIHNGTLHSYNRTSDDNYTFHQAYQHPEFTSKLESIGINCDWVEKTITQVLTKLTLESTKK